MTAAPTTTELVTLSDYQAAGGFIVLAPAVAEITGAARSDVLYESVAVITINPSTDAGEVYHDFRFANARDGKVALTSIGLGKIATAAGIEWQLAETGVEVRERRADGHVFVRYRAVGGLRLPNGQFHLEVCTKAVDTADEQEALEDQDRRTWERTVGRSDAPSWVKKLGPEADLDGTLERAIATRVKAQLFQLREHIEEHAETKAKNRVIRRLLSLRQTYSISELKSKPFAVPRLLYRPDATDPMALEQAQLQGRQAAASIFGAPPTTRTTSADEHPTASLPSPDPSPSPAASEPATEPERPTAEVEAEAGAGEGSSQRPEAALWEALLEAVDGDVPKARRTITKALRRSKPVTVKNQDEVTMEELQVTIAWLQENEGE